jgi:uncharacterized protein YjbI with pentapeptide repeats
VYLVKAISDAWGWYETHASTVNPIVAGLGGAALVWAAVRQARTATNRHYEQTRADLQRRLTESFSKAVEQLSSDKIEARLGGIYTLERLAIEAITHARPMPRWGYLLHRNRPTSADPIADLYWTVMETLTAFLRERASWRGPQAAIGAIADKADYLWGTDARMAAIGPMQATDATDIAAVLAVFRRRFDLGRARERQRDWRLDLHTADLRGANLSGVHLEGANLQGAHLEGANLYGANLEGAILRNAWLQRANLDGAHLEGAILSDAHLEGAVLTNARLEGARLDGAHLERSYLTDARLEGAILSWAHLQGTRLAATHLEGATLYGAQLEAEALTDLIGAYGDAATILPDGIERPRHWPEYDYGRESAAMIATLNGRSTRSGRR